MATKKEIDKHLKLALKEIGKINPWYDKEVNAWVFESPLYPVGYAGDSKEDVISRYPLHLREFILERLNDNLNALVEKETKGHGGARHGAGRPKGSTKTSTKQIRIPENLYKATLWLRQHPEALPEIQKLMRKYA